MTPLRALLLAGLCTSPLQAVAQALGLPANARLEAEKIDPFGSLSLPAGAWRNGGAEMVTAEGPTILQAWQMAPTDLSTLQLLSPLRDQLEAEGFETLFTCDARACGGFEFRYSMDLLPEPAMHVDLGDFRYLLAERRSTEGVENVAVVVSRATDRGFIHVARVGIAAGSVEGAEISDSARVRPMPRGGDDGATTATAEARPLPAALPGVLAEDLDTTGHAVLWDLSFETGSSRLEEADFASLVELAAWMNAHPEAGVVLVGHTDAVGALAGNIDLSRKRAGAVRDRLRDRHGIAGRRMDAEGVGYLAPLDTNATDAGRTANRRVEVVLTGGG